MLSRAALLPLVLLPRCSPPRLEQQPFVPALEAEWDAERTPRLPPDALVLEEEDNDLMRNLFDIFDLDDSGTLEMQEMIIGLSAYCADVSPVER